MQAFPKIRYRRAMEHSETTPGTDERLSDRLTPMQYHCTQEAGTEQAFTGEYWDEKRAGTYRCVVCGEALFDSDTKYDSGSGWPSFWEPLTEGLVDNHQDTSHGTVRTARTPRHARHGPLYRPQCLFAPNGASTKHANAQEISLHQTPKGCFAPSGASTKHGNASEISRYQAPNKGMRENGLKPTSGVMVFELTRGNVRSHRF